MSKKVQNLYLELSHAVADLPDPPMCSEPVYRDWFFPEGFIPIKGKSSAAYLAEQKAMQLSAVRICLSCPVRALCAEYAITAGEPFGIWGATTPENRKTIASSANKRV
jgi:WhiB family redox-sensing transcriptional regulator